VAIYIIGTNIIINNIRVKNVADRYSEDTLKVILLWILAVAIVSRSATEIDSRKGLYIEYAPIRANPNRIAII